MNHHLTFISMVLLFLIVVSMQYVVEGQSPTCYGRNCPELTTSCKKHMKSSIDRTKLEITVNCLDDYNGSLREYYIEEVNTLNPYTHYESTSYSGTGNMVPVNGNYIRGNGIEDFL